ncbi:MAG: enoyl-CoA hydratase/isomerase family protein [Caulobacterales bacterium]|nr:enoyl-CoA hydratase/isomerase family protein [Caulobacterales bacterium]
MADAGDEVLYARVGRIGVATLNRPHARNAVNGALAARMEAIVDEIEADSDVWAAILASSSDRTFCAGADLKEVAAGIDAMTTTRGGFAGFVDAHRRKPWIAAVTGSALGGGLELALACDMIVAGESTVLGLPEVRRSLLAGAGGVYRLPRAVPRHVGLEMVATGRPISAQQALAFGLVNRIAPDAQVLDAALELAGQVAENPPQAVQESLQIARQHADLSDASLRDLTRAAYDRMRGSLDYQEGPRAFIEKRSPRWLGR